MYSTKCEKPNPRLQANPISRLFFWWINPLFWYGQKHNLEAKDLYKVLPDDRSEKLGDKLERYWNKELENARRTNEVPNLLRALRRTFIWSYLPFAGYIFTYTIILRPLQPYVLGRFIQHFDHRSTSTNLEGYLFATGIIVIGILQAILEHQCIMGQSEIGMRVRVACSSLIYRKVLRLSNVSATKLGGGMVTNLLTNDVKRFDAVFQFLHHLWAAPLQIVLISYLIWQSVGIASLAGMLWLILQTIPVQLLGGVIIGRVRSKTAFRTDERVRQMTEIISGIRVIKIYAWEHIFHYFASIARRYELNAIRIFSYVQGTTLASFVFTERATLYVTTLAYVLQGNFIRADTFFSMAQYYNVLQATIIYYLFEAVSEAAQSRVSINRIQEFLLLDEICPKILDPPTSDESSVSLKGANAAWIEDPRKITNTLHDLTVNVPSKQLLTILGPVGSGKSTFLKLLMNELHTSSGIVSVQGTVSYSSQDPWLFSGSIRSNILFGEIYDEEKYKNVTKACALVQDFNRLPYGDKTIVGDNGVTLSGGQCARINLARAAYKDADIYLLDDPFSAIDVHVGKELFKNCVKTYLQNTTRILVAHQLQYLKEADRIILMKNGKIESQGTFADFLFEELNVYDASENEKFMNSSEPEEGLKVPLSKTEEDDEPEETKELMSKGNVPKALYWVYCRTGASYCVLIILLLCHIAAHLLVIGCDYWPAHWINQQEFDTRQNKNVSFTGDTNFTEFENVTEVFATRPSGSIDTNTALIVHGSLLLGTVIMCIVKNIFFFEICINASKNFHNEMLTSLLKAPVRFFDMHTTGEILNRFSKDLGGVDELLPTFMLNVIQTGFVSVGIILQVFIIEWRLVFIAVIMCYVYWKINDIYLATAQDLQRLEGIAKSPVLSFANSSLSGLLTIRSAQAQAMTSKQFDAFQDDHTSAYFLYIATTISYSFWLAMVSVVFMGIVVSSFFLLDNSKIYAGNVGLAVSQSFILCVMFHHAMRLMAVMHAQMVSIERIAEYTRLDEEGPFSNEPGQESVNHWPLEGSIQFDHVYLRYSNGGKFALKNIDLTINSGAKIGIAGRTGAGKSSILTALFRLAEFDGSIFVDSRDIRTIGLTDLRRKMSIIPQNPMLFSGSLRENLDPLNEFEDASIWSALRDVEMNKTIVSLDHPIEHKGGNLSAGQRQLLCLARAILKNNKILVLDEATANVDLDTSALIQKTIRNMFKNCTVLNIAHRLNFIMDNDKVMVMSNGEVVEFDDPYVLLQRRGYFFSMIQEAGMMTKDLLTDIDRKACTECNEDS